MKRVALRAGWLLLLVTAHVARADDWPGWRGPTGMGHATDRGLPLSWGDKGGDNLLWKAPLLPAKARPDQNQSSPVVCRGRVFLTLSYWPNGASQKDFPEHHVLCFQVSDGRRLWDTRVPPGPWLLHDLRGGYTAPTPACDGQRLYVLFGSAVLAGLDREGKLLWRKEITPHHFDVAIGTSPVLYKNRVLLCCDQISQFKASVLLAFDGKTGELKWRRPRPDADWDHSTPVLANLAGRTQLLAATGTALQGLDPATGAVLWQFRSTERIGDTVTPVLGKGLVYCDSGRGGPGVAVDPTGRGELPRSSLKWQIKHLPEGFSSPLVVGDYLYRLHAPGVVECRKMATGELVFKERLPGIEPAVSPVATADGRIFFASAGISYVLKAGSRPTILGRSDLGDPSRASPAVSDGRLFLKGGRYLYCIRTK
jgi:outer membrane protein assembly factor BamB